MAADTFWQSLYWALYGLWIVAEITVVFKTRTRRSSGGVQDRGTMLVLWVVIFSSIGVANSIAATHPHNLFATARFHYGWWLLPLSAIVLALGLAIRGTAIVTLGRSFSVNVAIHQDQKVMRTGVFRYARHPSYTGLILIFAAIGLHLRNWESLLVVLIPPTAALLYRIRVEEAALNRAFGPEYADYCACTRRLIPGIY
jgi:protein-S-isoprenylcysteine O-methyltransferase Ste14